MRKVAKSIIHMEVKPEILEELREMFYDIARKHGIKGGELYTTAESLANPEWTMAREFFMQTLVRKLKFDMLSNFPKDLINEEEKS